MNARRASLVPILVTFGQVVGVIGLSAAQQTQLPGGSITLQIIEEGTSAPIAEAQIRLMNVRPLVGQFFEPPREALTDKDGRYRFERLPPGRCNVSVHKTGYASAEPPDPPALVVIEASSVTHRCSSSPASIAIANLSGAHQSPSSGGIIIGRVVEKGANAPLAYARVMAIAIITSPSAASPPPPQYQANTGSDGTFRIEGCRWGDTA